MKKMYSGQHAVRFVAKNIAGRYWLILVWLLALAFSGCEEKECAKPGNWCGTPNGSGTCNTFVTVRNSMCGAGIWGSLWLQLDNGEYLQPWESPLNLPASVSVGQRLKINYQVVQRDNRYDNQITCMAVPPAAKPIRITCLETVPPVDCGTTATVILDGCFPAYWGDVSLQLADGSILRPWEGLPLSQPLQHGQQVKIGYEVSTATKNYQLICNTFQAIPPFTPIKVTCLEPGELPAGAGN